MIFLNEGDQTEIKGSGKKPYIVKKSGGVVSCSCPAWRNMGGGIDTRSCKHIKANIDPACLLPQARFVQRAEEAGDPESSILAGKPVKLTKTGKVSTAVGGAVVKDTAPPVLLAHSFKDEDPTGWWMSEKLDGVRAWWDGENFISRLGNIYHAPEWYKQMMPKGIILDGELFLGQGKFQETISIVRKHVPGEMEWNKIQYWVFDAPRAVGTFETRIAYLEELLEAHDGPFCWNLLPQIQCKGPQHLQEFLKDIQSNTGEGVMLRAPGSVYEEGRSNTLLKVKSFFDAEATVIETQPGKGKHKGRMGALLVEMENGKQFSVGSGFTDKQREQAWASGTKITYRYQELTKDGIPRFPTFVAERDYE